MIELQWVSEFVVRCQIHDPRRWRRRGRCHTTSTTTTRRRRRGRRHTTSTTWTWWSSCYYCMLMTVVVVVVVTWMLWVWWSALDVWQISIYVIVSFLFHSLCLMPEWLTPSCWRFSWALCVYSKRCNKVLNKLHGSYGQGKSGKVRENY